MAQYLVVHQDPNFPRDELETTQRAILRERFPLAVPADMWEAPLDELRRFHALRDPWAALNRRAQHVLETWAELMPTEHSNGPAHIPLPMYPSVLVDLHLELAKPHTRDESLASVWDDEDLEEARVTGAALGTRPTGAAHVLYDDEEEDDEVFDDEDDVLETVDHLVGQQVELGGLLPPGLFQLGDHLIRGDAVLGRRTHRGRAGEVDDGDEQEEAVAGQRDQ